MSNRSIYSERDDDLNEEGTGLAFKMGDFGLEGLSLMSEHKNKKVFI